jgi:hypothetical protein
VFGQVVKCIAAVTEAVKELGKPQLSACGDTAQLSKRRVCSKLHREEKKNA